MNSVPVFLLNTSRYYGPMKPSCTFLVKKKRKVIFHFYLLITNLLLKSFRLETKVQRKSWKPVSGIQPLLDRGIRNGRMWNPESMDMESGIHSLESRIQGSLGLPYMDMRLSRLRVYTVII